MQVNYKRADGSFVVTLNGLPYHVVEGDPLFDKIDPTGVPDEPVPAAEPLSVQQVKAEAQRRILALCPEWKQRNLTAQAVILAKKGADNWTPEEQTAWDAGEALWTQIAAIRAASDVIEQLDPIPQDFTDDSYWP